MTNSIESLLDDLRDGCCARPFDVLGVHDVDYAPSGVDPSRKEKIVRVWRPDALSVHLVDLETGQMPGEMVQVTSGVFERVLDAGSSLHVYRLEIQTKDHQSFTYVDPWQFGAHVFSQVFVEPYRSYRYMGARLVSITAVAGQDVQGAMFRVYAPHARSVALVGSFNGWDARLHPMQASDDGIWRLFIPHVCAGDLYKFELRDLEGTLLPHKSDPYGFYAEQPPGNASIVYDQDRYRWQDSNWLHQGQLQQPVSVYEVHLGSWRREGRREKQLNGEDRWLTYQELANELIPYVVEQGFTHIELLPPMEHPFSGSWGYQPVGLYAPTSRFGSPDDFKAFVDRCHQNGLGVILDWVPAHFPSDPHGLGRFDGTPLYEYADPKRGWHPDWQTHIYDYGKPAVRDFLISNALFWLDCFHIDGLRVDAVASMLYLDYSRAEGEWEPNIHGGNEHLEAVDFLKRLNETVYGHYPDAITIAEESTSWPGVSKPTYENGLGFGYKWNMGWMHDSLEYMKHEPQYRRYHHGELMFSMEYHYSEHFILALSHDEVVHGKGTLLGKMPGDDWRRFANLRAYYGFMFAHPGKKLLFMGAEIGSLTEWNHDDQLDWTLLDDDSERGIFSRGVHKLVRDLNQLYRSHPALYQSDYDSWGFSWVVGDDTEQSVYAFLRRGGSQPPVLVVCNFTPEVRYGYRVGVPTVGKWYELLNTDAAAYGGSGVINADCLNTEFVEAHGYEQSLVLTLPPLGTVFLIPDD
ncbi:glycogen branching protein [Endozoicomonas montiporae]|uniref:1,4-alpha-glucan branching enzyme GlgB n=2 Tax=Endozoicomonas montiporae TaxID=1027273 RepID=A0A081N8J0_9GAMM|nr:1,4-alpha-glucan branching protein GlgB [Endozoicomonas montiporae]AMO55335.1 glycogen branching enzyme [Endozoicomonas montiporae CL-33]KEQ14763.1 glycogen branching protein [Endozoicomonas montiporae]